VTSSTPKPGGSVAFVVPAFYPSPSTSIFRNVTAKLKGSNQHCCHKILKLVPMPSRTQPGKKLLILGLSDLLEFYPPISAILLRSSKHKFECILIRIIV